jgi:hypothetical protein
MLYHYMIYHSFFSIHDSGLVLAPQVGYYAKNPNTIKLVPLCCISQQHSCLP